MKRNLYALLVVFGLFVYAHADGPIGQNTVVPVAEQAGNKAEPIAVSWSTSVVIIVSSSPANISSTTASNGSTHACYGSGEWRRRLFVNNSNGGVLLFFNSDDFSVYSSTKGVHLSSNTFNQGDSYTYYGQSPVYAIWNPATTDGGLGGVEECYK